MLSREVQERIIEFVRQQPRTVQELATLVSRNWRTADRYVQEIMRETGVLGMRTFREGTRGALKVVYYTALEPRGGSAFEQRLLDRVRGGKHKEDFSAMDVFQFATDRSAFLQSAEFEPGRPFSVDVALERAREQVLFYSGNMSWFSRCPDVEGLIVKAATRGVRIKVLARVDVTNAHVLVAVRDINARCGRDVIEVRHCEQPIRGMVIDEDATVLKEMVKVTREGEFTKGKFLFYVIEDAVWVSWLHKAFWHLWGAAVDAQVRLGALEQIK